MSMKWFSLAVLVVVFPVIARAQIGQLDSSYAAARASGDFQAHLALIEQNADRNGKDFDFLWRAARGWSAVADQIYWKFVLDNIRLADPEDVDDALEAEAEFSNEQRKELAECGLKIGRFGDAAMALEPDRVEGRYFHAVGVSFYALGRSMTAALREGLRSKFSEGVENSLKVKPEFAEAGAVRMKARAYYTMPWPLRDYKRSIELLKTAIEYAPQNTVNHLFLGDSYWRNGDRDSALKAWNRANALSSGGGKLNAVERFITENASIKAKLAVS